MTHCQGVMPCEQGVGEVTKQDLRTGSLLPPAIQHAPADVHRHKRHKACLLQHCAAFLCLSSTPLCLGPRRAMELLSNRWKLDYKYSQFTPRNLLCTAV